MINAMFFIELLTDFVIHGIINSYVAHFRTWPETLCQLLNILGIIRFVNNHNDFQMYNSIVKTFELIIFIRALKLLTLLYEIKVMRIIIETMRNMMMPLVYLLSILYLIYY